MRTKNIGRSHSDLGKAEAALNVDEKIGPHLCLALKQPKLLPPASF